MTGKPVVNYRSLVVAILIPCVAAGLQWLLWPYIQPFIWFLFYPAVFLSSWIGGRWSGLLATLLSVGLAVYVFAPPMFTFQLDSPNVLFSAAMFVVMGVLFSYVHVAWKQANRRLDLLGQLQASEARYRELAQHANSAIIRWRCDGAILFFNEYAQTLFGYPADEIIGQPVGILVPRQESTGGDLSALVQNIVDHPEQFENTVNENVCRDGRRVWMMWTNAPVRDATGQVTEILAVGMDITTRKQAEEALRESKAKLVAALESMTDAVFISDADGRFVDFNEAFATFHRFRNKAECLKTLAEYPEILDVFMTNGELAPLDQWAVPRALRGETGTNVEYGLRRKDTGETWVGSYSFAPIRDKDGAIVGSVVVGRDITEHKRVEKQIVQLTRLYATLSQVNQTIVRVQNRDDLYQSICNVAVQFGEFSLAWIGLLDEASGEVKPVAANGLDVTHWPFQMVNIHKGDSKNGLVATAIRTSEVVTSEDIEADERTQSLHEQFSKYDYHSSAAVPFRLKGKTIGMLSLNSREAGLFKAEEEVPLLDEMGLDISFALDMMEAEAERKQAEEQIRTQAARLKILADASQAFAAIDQDYQVVLDQVVRQVTEALADMCQMRLLSDDGQLLKLAAIYSRDSEFSQALRKIAPSISERTDDPGMASYVFRTGKPAFVPVITVDQLLTSLPPEYEGIDLRFAPHSYIVVSLRVQGRSIGVLALTRYQAGRPAFTEDDLSLAQDLADRAALAINSARLFQQAQDELTERQRAEARILRLNRLYATLSQINQTIVHAGDRDTLFREICRVTIEFGQFRMAWIGLIDETEQRVKPVMFAGEELGYLTNVRVTYRDEPLGHGPTGTAIREGRCVICQDIATNPLMTPWRDQALQRGYRSSAAVPFSLNHDVVGALTVYASEPDGFDTADQQLLDEVGLDISFALDTLEREAQRRRAESALSSLNLELEERVVRRTQELAAANERLTELDRLKSKFVSDVSHELRSPVTSLGLYIDLLERGKPEKRDHYVAQLQEQKTRLYTLINDILDLSRLERDLDETGRSPVDINVIVEHVSAMERVAAETAGLTLTCETADNVPAVVVRPDQLARAITNLVSNAIKYTRSGSVRVQTCVQGERVGIQVADTGLGIAPEDVPHLFERFYRGRAIAQSSIPGTGLGLSIVKEIVESHGGTVEVESQLGAGSTFRIWLPVVA